MRYKVLFVSSANRIGISPIISNQGNSLVNLGCEVHYFGILGNGFWGYLNNIFKLRRHLRDLSPDVIHAHYSLSAFVASLCFYRKPLVVSLMGSDTKARRFYIRIIRIFNSIFWKTLIVKSAEMKENIGLIEAHIIPNGVETDFFKPMDAIICKKQFSFSEKKCNILFLANPNRSEKNFELAARAIEILQNPSVELKMLYNQKHDDVPGLINAADIILLTSLWEGSPNIVKEAMSCNRSVVSTDVGDVKWLFGNEPGYFITTFEPEDVAAKINQAIEFSRKHRRTNGRSRIFELGLDAGTIAEKLATVYQTILEKYE
jgi:teichuronic acid biosynthesis glycosyltransferase TuaC